MEYFGFYAQVLRGETFQQNTDNGKNVHRQFCRWRDKGIWENILTTLVDDADFEWLMIDASHVKVPPDAAGAKGGNQEMGRTKGSSTRRYIWPWMLMVCR